jgi:hypothetical protein
MEDKGFFASLFDLSFSEFITPRIIKLLFIISIIVSAIGAGMLLVSGLDQGDGAAFFALIGAPLLFLLYVIMARVWLEVIMVLFRIADNTDQLAGRGNAQAAPDQEPES